MLRSLVGRFVVLDRIGEHDDLLRAYDPELASLGEALPLVLRPRARVELLKLRIELLRELGRTDAIAADARLGLQEAQAIGDTAAIAAFTAALGD